MKPEAHIIIQIVERPVDVKFSTRIESRLQKKGKEIYSLDNFADAISINLAAQFVKESELTCIYVMAQEYPLGSLVGFFRQIKASKTRTSFHFVGRHAMMEKLLLTEKVFRYEDQESLCASLV